MTEISSPTTFAHCAAAIVFALATSSCAGDTQSDGGVSQMRAGLTETRSALSKTQSGIDDFVAGSRQSGATGISNGMAMMDHGLDDVGKGIGMMSRGMMNSCANGDSATIVSPMQQARDEMHQGQSMMGVDATSSDDEGLTRLRNGMAMMNNALGQADTCMTCMHHGGMM